MEYLRSSHGEGKPSPYTLRKPSCGLDQVKTWVRIIEIMSGNP